MKKNVRQLITRQSMSLIQSNALSNHHKIIICPRVSIEQKWLHSQLKARYLHQYQKIKAESKVKTFKDMYIQNLQVKVNNQSTITKYYPFNQTFKAAFKRIIKVATVKDQMKPIIKSHLYQQALRKIDKINKEREIERYNSKNKKIKQKINKDNRDHKSPVLSKKVSVQKIPQKNRNLLGVATQRKTIVKQQNYGLKKYQFSNKLVSKALGGSKSKSKKSKQNYQLSNDYNLDTYLVKQNFKSCGKHKKSLSNSRKLLLPQPSSKKLKLQTERSNDQRKAQKKSIKKKRA